MSTAIVTLRDDPAPAPHTEYFVDGYVFTRGEPGQAIGATWAVLIDPSEGIFLVEPISRLRWIRWSER